VLALLASSCLAAAPLQSVDPQTGALRLKAGLLSGPLSGEPSSAVLSWALGQRSELGLPATSGLKTASSFGTRFGASFHLQQTVAGLDVYGARLVVTLDAHARVVQLSSSLVAFGEVQSTWTVDADAALRVASRRVPLPALRDDGTPWGGGRAVFFPVGDALHAGWLVHVPTVDLRHNWYVAIDATDGEVLWKRDRVAHAALDADAYEPSPGGLDAGVGVVSTTRVQLVHPDGGSMLLADGGGFLAGAQLDAFNCCLSLGCAPDAGPKRATGMTLLPGGTAPVSYDVVVCDRRQRAANTAGSFVYPPVDPPTVSPPAQADPASSDAFAEVHAFYQLNRAYDRVRALAAPPFPLGKLTAWVNVVFPDLQACGATCTVDRFTRLDNAAFVTVEEGMNVPLPDYRNTVDTVMLFQGNGADFAYDATVLWHELGHGLVFATAKLDFDTLTVSQRAGNTEGGALHEAFADYTAAIQGAGPTLGAYVGPRSVSSPTDTGLRTDTFARSVDNSARCPDVLTGEPHLDSQHVSGALWQARRDHFQGSDQGATFDAAWYAMLVSLAPQPGFADMAAAMDLHVDEAFPDGGAVMESVFAERGVTLCSDVVEALGSRGPFIIGSHTQTTLASGSLIPGPYQLLVRTPQGATSLSLSATVPSGEAPTIKLLARAGDPIKFTKLGTTLISDATTKVDASFAGAGVTAQAALDSPCDAGSELYVAIANLGPSAVALDALTVTVTPKPECVPPGQDAGPGPSEPDGGSLPALPDGGFVLTPPATHCGCASASWALPFAGLSLRRRRAR
jgi:hypothetical protein